jgi:hypothetical protein
MIDRTEWYVGSEPVNILAAGISLDGEVALPVAWVALPKEGGSSAGEQVQVLDRLQHILTTLQSQPTAFFECLRLLRSPTSLLSCT